MFSLKGRIGRKEFLIRMVLLIIASLILNFISSWFGGNSPLARITDFTTAGRSQPSSFSLPRSASPGARSVQLQRA